MKTLHQLIFTLKKWECVENEGNFPKLEVAGVVIIHCNVLNNDGEQEPTAYYTFISNKSFGKLLEMKSSLEFLESFRSEFSITEIYFIVHYSEPLKLEPKVNVAYAILP